MINYKTVGSIALLFFLALNPVIGEEPIDGMDNLIDEVAERTVTLLGRDGETVLAVYYFTVEGERSGVSDYLIGGLTTEIANRGGGRIKIVSRQVLDRILTEYSFQMSDLADRKNQVQIGGQLGADVILTGFITPLAGVYKLNVQIVHVDTGIVRGGFIVDFLPEEEFKKQIEAGRTSVSEVVTVEDRPLGLLGAATRTTVLENFNSGRSKIPVDFHKDSWGDRIVSSSGTISVDQNGGPDGSSCLRLSFEGGFDTDNTLEGWEDSDLSFYLNIRLPEAPEAADGIRLSLKPEGFSAADVFLKQNHPGEDDTYFYLTTVLNTDEWQDLRIPFYDFFPDEQGTEVDPGKGMTLSVSIPYLNNYHRFHFRTGNRMDGALLIDNPGYYSIKGEDDPSVLDAFDDDINRMMFHAEIYGTSTYWDYSVSDEGVERVTPGINGQTIVLERREGDSGRFLSVRNRLDIDEEFVDFVEKEHTLGFYLKAVVGKSWQGYSALSFQVRSDLLREGSLEIYIEETENYYYYDLGVNPIWTRVAIPFSALLSEDHSLADADQPVKLVRITYYFDIPTDLLVQAAREGSLEFTLDLDDIVLE